MTVLLRHPKGKDLNKSSVGTEYVRANLLAADSAASVRELLRTYLDQRIAFCHDQRQVSDADKARPASPALVRHLARGKGATK